MSTTQQQDKRASWKRFVGKRSGDGKAVVTGTEQPLKDDSTGGTTESSAKQQQQQTTNKKNNFLRKAKGGARRFLNPTTPKHTAKKGADGDGNSGETRQENGSPSNPQSPSSEQPQLESKSKLYEWQDEMEQKRAMEIAHAKQMQKERDGFCRTVDSYDGQVITVDGKPSYELGNYLGGGVAGVVYEGNRLLRPEEYPVRTGSVQSHPNLTSLAATTVPSQRRSFLCGSTMADVEPERSGVTNHTAGSGGSLARDNSLAIQPTTPADAGPSTPKSKDTEALPDSELAIETTGSSHVLVDRIDAPSRSRVAAQTAASSMSNWFSEETVAIKILNPVGFRLLGKDQTKDAVVVKQGIRMSLHVQSGKSPMQDVHVWWLVNPSSRNLQTLIRYNQKSADKRTRDIDRGSAERGLRLSLVAAYMDETGCLRELPLTRCIEIWGHIPFSASDSEFDEMMNTIERVNAGQPAGEATPSRVPTGSSNESSVVADSTVSFQSQDFPKKRMQTGLYKAATRSRQTVYCESLNAFIAVPEVPPKYLRWLRQRRAATKEIRNMMLIGRHRNVVHLYEVLEYIQDSKSTMFLILELVRGGELFDLISSSSTSERYGRRNTEEAMRKYFRELASGIHYCHTNGIAHRDLKPENLLVHNGPNEESTLKIADFGLSATFGVHDEDAKSLAESTLLSPMGSPANSPLRGMSTPQRKTTYNESSEESTGGFSSAITSLSSQALQMLTCGTMEDVTWCAPSDIHFEESGPASPLRRMTSVVGSPHYVAPEIISQTDDKKKKKQTVGYDGTKADVWSAGVILYAMLFRSLPFGEDLLRCPRFQSFRKWYIEAVQSGGRRATGMASLNPVITEADEQDQLGPHWFFPSETTKESRDMIVAMLNPDPEERLSIEMVLQHPWLREVLR